MQPRRRGSGHLGERGVGDVGGTGQLPGAKLVRLRPHAVQLVLGDTPQDGGRPLGNGVDDDQVAETLEEILNEPPRVVTGLDHPIHCGEDGRSVPGSDGVDDVVKQGRVGVAEQGDGQLIVDAGLTGTRHQLVEHGEGVAD